MPENNSGDDKKIILLMNPHYVRDMSVKNIRGSFFPYLAGILIFYIFAEMIPNVVGIYMPRSYFALSVNASDLGTLTDALPKMPFVTVLYSLLMLGALTLGRTFYSLTFLRNRTVNYGMIFEGFSFYGKACLLYIIQTFLEGIGLICFVIPGIMISYNYSQSLYILADDTSKGVIQCLRESRFRMQGNRWTLFTLDLSYIWYLLIGYLPAALLTSYGAADTSTVSGMLLYYLARVPFYMAMAEFIMGRTIFYELLCFGSFEHFQYAGEGFFRARGKNK